MASYYTTPNKCRSISLPISQFKNGFNIKYLENPAFNEIFYLTLGHNACV